MDTECDVMVTEYVYVICCEFAPVEREEEWDRWYDEVHIPGILSVPGIHGVTRCKVLKEPGHFVTIYDIDSPNVFEHPRYAEVRGWGPWEPNIVHWSREVLRREGLAQ